MFILWYIDMIFVKIKIYFYIGGNDEGVFGGILFNKLLVLLYFFGVEVGGGFVK